MTVPERPDFAPMFDIIDSHPEDPAIIELSKVLDEKDIPHTKHVSREGKVFAFTVAAEAAACIATAFALLPPDQAAGLLVLTSPATGPATIIGGACAAFFSSLGHKERV